MSVKRIQQLSVKFTNNCTQIGILASQIEAAKGRMDAILRENAAIEAEHASLSKLMKEEAEEAAKVAQTSQSEPEKAE